MDELLAQFLVEGPELLEQANDALLALEKAPEDLACLNDAFRAVHTLKGSVGFFDLPALEHLLHAAEDSLGALRQGGRAEAEIVDALLAVLDQTEAWLGALAEAGVLPADAPRRSADLVARLSRAPGSDGSSSDAVSAEVPSWATGLTDVLPPESRVAIRYSPDKDAYFRGEDPLRSLAAAPELTFLRLVMTASADGAYDPFTCALVIEAASASPLQAVRESLRAIIDQAELAELPDNAAGTTRGAQTARALRIEPARIDELAALADELVAAKTGLARLAAQAAGERSLLSQRLTAQAEVIDRLASRLHQGIGALRMTPVQPLLRQFPRVAREMAASLGKDVDLLIEAGQIHADRIILEGLFEPLTHLLRNAIDHGAETAAVRVAKGKPARNTIRLSARQAAGRLLVTVEDDGRGIDPVAVRATALRRGLMDEDALAALSDEQAIELVFTPGFSTASAVSALSGRGVGMDAVRTSVHRLGGRISLSSRVDAGAAVELSLPLAVSLTQVMVVSEAAERYGLPVEGVLATLRLPASDITAIRAGHAFDWRGRTVPLLPLSHLTGGEGRIDGADRRVLVVNAGGQSVGLAVDSIDDRLDVAIRPLDGLLAGMGGLAGTAILDDGQVLMILDPEALAS